MLINNVHVILSSFSWNLFLRIKGEKLRQTATHTFVHLIGSKRTIILIYLDKLPLGCSFSKCQTAEEMMAELKDVALIHFPSLC